VHTSLEGPATGHRTGIARTTRGLTRPAPLSLSLLLATVIALALPAAAAAQQQRGSAAAVDTLLYKALKWRSIGPYRGGRSAAVTGVRGKPKTFYFGGTGSGVWKTVDGGITWKNVSDGWVHTGSVGAIAVAESDPNVVYLGMGENPVRSVTTSHGDGVYRSTDAGHTWAHLGLVETRHISAIRIDPRDPDVVYVAAQGPVYKTSQERGIYKSTDGGRSWKKVLYVDSTTGPSDLSMDMTNPRILYAAMWDHHRYPWTIRSGPNSSIWKTTDGGDHWTKLTRGLPEHMGKIGVSVSRADPQRIYANVEADSGGLYRSDDGGKSWKWVNKDRVLRARAWYYTKVFADPQDANTVYVLNAPVLRSVDGGQKFKTVPVPHGDTHDLWINPDDDRDLINANDGGAIVSFDAGESWSTEENQPTAQFYRVNVDDEFPYHVYGGQQDNTPVIIASRTMGGGIGWKDWKPGPGCESAYLAFDPHDPRYVYGDCYQGIAQELDQETGLTRNVQVVPYLGLATIPKEVPYRFNWNAPLLVSRYDPRVIYMAGNRLFRSADRGHSWKAISPDLTRDDTTHQGPGGRPYTIEGAGGAVYNTIMYVEESKQDSATIWVGSDDGLVHLTRDGGATWENVTPKGLPEGMVNSIETSSHDPATAYVVYTRYKFGDFTPHIYRTTDWGKSWTDIARGIPVGHWVRAVREDPVRRGLLYAGTELGVYVSFDDGGHWQSLQQNLPVVPVTDLIVHGADLVASTQGRAFWILTDLSPLRQLGRDVASAPAHLFAPSAAIRTGGGGRHGPNEGQNPPNGAILYYSLAEAAKDSIALDVLDAAGQEVRHFSSAAPDTVKMLSGSVAAPRLPASKGLNRFVWDLRAASLPAVPDIFLNGNLHGHRVAPGTYTVRLTAAGKSYSQPLQVVTDPRIHAPASEYEEQQKLVSGLDASVDAMLKGVIRVTKVRDQVRSLVELAGGTTDGDTVAQAGKALDEDLTGWIEQIIQPRQKTFQDVINFHNELASDMLYLRDAADGVEPKPTQGEEDHARELQQKWSTLRSELDRLLTQSVPAFNALVKDAGVGPVIVPQHE
jgi:photosystem II stability/assembly factor-like uncharacterized protein